MKKSIFILFCLVFLTSFNQRKTDDESLLNQILQQIVENDETILSKNLKIVNGFNSPLQIPARAYFQDNFFVPLDPYFKKEDMDYYKEQVNRNTKIKLLRKGTFKDYKFIERKKIVNFIAKRESDYIKEIEHDYNKMFNEQIGPVQEFGLPLISKDGKFVKIRFLSMKSSQDKSGFVRIYENVGNKWILKETIMEW
jgi:hypothetical protein